MKEKIPESGFNSYSGHIPEISDRTNHHPNAVFDPPPVEYGRCTLSCKIRGQPEDRGKHEGRLPQPLHAGGRGTLPRDGDGRRPCPPACSRNRRRGLRRDRGSSPFGRVQEDGGDRVLAGGAFLGTGHRDGGRQGHRADSLRAVRYCQAAGGSLFEEPGIDAGPGEGRIREGSRA